MKSDLLLFLWKFNFYLIYNPDLSVNNKYLLYFYREKKKSFQKFYVLKYPCDMSVRFLYQISELLMIVKFKDLDNYHMTEGIGKQYN